MKTLLLLGLVVSLGACSFGVTRNYDANGKPTSHQNAACSEVASSIVDLVNIPGVGCN